MATSALPLLTKTLVVDEPPLKVEEFLYSTLPVVEFLTNISVAELLLTGVLIMLNVCPERLPNIIESPLETNPFFIINSFAII